MAYGELLRRAANLARHIGEPSDSEQTRLAIVAMSPLEGFVGLIAGLIAGAVVISTPIQSRDPWPVGLLGDPDVVLTDDTGAALLACNERLTGVRPDYRAVSIEEAGAGAVSVAPRICADQDDVCKIAYLDPRRSPLVVALTGFALDHAVRNPWRVPAASGGLSTLAGQIETYQRLASGEVVHLATQSGDRPIATTLPAADAPYVVDNPTQMADLLLGVG
ncbi:hypothetical protein [Actinoplanes teichomyceticus]|nr:hypothetical protein [Actinoplanes teichomyceticus]